MQKQLIHQYQVKHHTHLYGLQIVKINIYCELRQNNVYDECKVQSLVSNSSSINNMIKNSDCASNTMILCDNYSCVSPSLT